jgi:hypothetical protein
VLILRNLGIDATNDDEMSKLQNWLLFGLSNTDVNNSVPKDTYQDCFFVISKDGF